MTHCVDDVHYAAHANAPIGSHAPHVEGAAMPTYEYRCNHCRQVFERQQHVAEHEKSHPRCPKCESRDVQPVLSDFYARTSKKA